MDPKRRQFLQGTAITLGTGVISGRVMADQANQTNPKQDGEPIDPAELPEVQVLSTGGTIASTQEAQSTGAGYELSKSGQQIVNSVPKLSAYARLSVKQVVQKPSYDLLPDDFADVARAARKAADQGMDGVVVTHGTDTIEEDSYYNDLVLDLDIPVVFVGAQRPGDAVSADGPSNLLTAVRAATREEFHLDDESSGVYVAMNEEVHAARDVTKGHTTKVEAFESPGKSPIAHFTDQMRFYRDPGSYGADLSSQLRTSKTVPIVTTGAGRDAFQIEQALAGNYDIDGIVIQATGRSEPENTSPAIEKAIAKAIKAGIPIVITTRVYRGPVETPPPDQQAISGGDLPAHKARLQLMLALERTTDLEELNDIFQQSNYGCSGLPPSSIEVREDGTVVKT